MGWIMGPLSSWVNSGWVPRWRSLEGLNLPGLLNEVWRCSAVGQCLVLQNFSSKETELFGFRASSGKPTWQVLLSWTTTKRDFSKLMNKTFMHWTLFYPFWTPLLCRFFFPFTVYLHGLFICIICTHYYRFSFFSSLLEILCFSPLFCEKGEVNFSEVMF